MTRKPLWGVRVLARAFSRLQLVMTWKSIRSTSPDQSPYNASVRVARYLLCIALIFAFGCRHQQAGSDADAAIQNAVKELAPYSTLTDQKVMATYSISTYKLKGITAGVAASKIESDLLQHHFKKRGDPSDLVAYYAPERAGTVMLTSSDSDVPPVEYELITKRLLQFTGPITPVVSHVVKPGLKRFDALGDWAQDDFDAGNMELARSEANELLALAPENKKRFDYGDAIYDANLVLGRIAVKEDRIDDAKRFLLAAGQTPGSPNLFSFGPRMSLAKDLLDKGEKDTVLSFFSECRRFWGTGGRQLDRWTTAVQAGQIPDFGTNS